MTATGVARPRAQGHETTRTETDNCTARLVSRPLPTTPNPVKSSQTTKTTRARMRIVGQKMRATRSASLARGALLSEASSTRAMIFPMVVSLPKAVTWSRIGAPRLMVPPTTLSPELFSTGKDSPVKALSLTEPVSETSVPSHGMLSPVPTKTVSPISKESVMTSSFVSPLTR